LKFLQFIYSVQNYIRLFEFCRTVTQDPNGRVVGVVSDGRDPTNTAREIQRLRPITYYTITVRATDGSDEGPEATFEAFTSPRPVSNPRVSIAFQEGVNLEWDEPSGDGADRYRIVNVDNEAEEYFAQTNQLYVQMSPGEQKHFTIQSVACGECVNPPNDAWGKPIDLVAVSIPPAPQNVEMSSIEMVNYEYADATIQWQNPEVGTWDHIKIEYSPNMPPAKTDTPFYMASNWGNNFKLEGMSF